MALRSVIDIDPNDASFNGLREVCRLPTRARALLATITLADPQEPMPPLVVGVARRLHVDIVTAMADEPAPES